MNIERSSNVVPLSELNLPCTYGNSAEGEGTIIQLGNSSLVLKGQVGEFQEELVVTFWIDGKPFIRTGAIVWTDESATAIKFTTRTDDNELELIYNLLKEVKN